MKMKMNHIEIKKTGEIFYSNSLNLLVEKVGTEVTGIATQSLRNYFSTNKTDLYENDNCIIRRGPYFPMQKPNVSRSRKKAIKNKPLL
jgi:hypothetical protein